MHCLFVSNVSSNEDGADGGGVGLRIFCTTCGMDLNDVKCITGSRK